MWPAQGTASLVDLGDAIRLERGQVIIFSSDQGILKRLVETASHETGPFDPHWLSETIHASLSMRLEQEVMIVWARAAEKGRLC